MAEQDKFIKVDDTPLDYDDDLYAVLEAVSQLAAKYYYLGTALGLKPTALEKIRSDHKNSDEALHEVIKQWLSRANVVKSKESSNSTWRALATAVAASAGGANPALASKIAAAHPVKKASKKKQGERKAGPSASGSATSAKSISKQAPPAATGSGKSTKGASSSSSASSKDQSTDKKSTTSTAKAIVTTPSTKSGGSATGQQKARQPSTTDGSSTEQQTIPKELFVRDPSDSICKKCGRVPREPMRPSCCGEKSESMLCKPCSEKSKSLCHNCKRKPEKWNLDPTLKAKISKRTMECPNKCGEKFTVSKYDEHLKQCPRTKGSGKKRPNEASKTEGTSKKPKIGQ